MLRVDRSTRSSARQATVRSSRFAALPITSISASTAGSWMPARLRPPFRRADSEP
jgi:hypothetical protein